MLNVSEMSRITKEILLNLPPSLTTEEALEHRKKVELEIAEMRKQGIMPELPYDFDDLPPLPASPDTTKESRPSKTNMIRANLGAGWAFAKQMEDELRQDQTRPDPDLND